MLRSLELKSLILFMIISTFLYGQNPIAYYPFDNNTLDLSGNKNNGVIIGGVTQCPDRFGNACGALSFNGVDGYIEVPNSISLKSPVTYLSVCCWFKIESSQQNNEFKWLTLICKGSEPTESPNNPQYRVQTFQSSVQSTISINTDFTEYDNKFAQHALQFGQWYFYTIVYDGSFVKTYLDGTKYWEFPYDNPLTPNDEALQIGKDIPGSLEYFTGSLDELRIYNIALTDKQITTLFNDDSNSSIVDEFTLNCQQNIFTTTEPGQCYATVSYNKPEFSINCGTASLKQIAGLPSGSQFPAGSNNLIFEVESNSGLKKSCYSKIIVAENEPPIIKCAGDTLLFVDENTTETIFEYQAPFASDNCQLENVSLTSGLESGSLFPLGQTKLQFTATDKSGNKSECGYFVTIKEKKSITNTDSTNHAPALDTIPQPTLNEDSTQTAIRLLDSLYHKKSHLTDSVKYNHELEFDNCVLTLLMYDDSQQDFDTVSVFFNGDEIVKREMIKIKENGTIRRLISLSSTSKNEFVFKAWNNGKISPNTLKIEFYEGDYLHESKKLKKIKPVQVKVLHSKPGVASAILLSCKTK